MNIPIDRITLGADAARDAGAAVAVDGGTVTLYPNGGADFVNLDFKFDYPKDALVYGDDWERAYGTLCWQKPDSSLPAMPWFGCLSWDGQAEFFGFGVETGPNALAAWRLTDTGLRLILDVRSGSEPLTLAKPLNLCKLVFLRERSESAYKSMRKFCKMMCPSPLLPKEPVFGGNNWYYSYGATDAACVMGDVDRIAKWTRELAVRPFMMVDVGWQPFLLNDDLCSGGPYPHGNYRFPDLSGMAREIHDRGVRPALWFRPLLSCESRPAEDYMKKGVLDPTVPSVEAQIEADASRISGWGFDMIKHDFSTYDLTGMFGANAGMRGIIEYPQKVKFHDKSQTTAQAIKRVYAAILRGAGDKLVMSCNAMGHLTAGLSHVQRIGDDTSGLDWSVTLANGVNALAFRLAQHNVFFSADPDCVGLTAKVDWQKNAQWMDIVARSGTPLFVAADPNALTSDIEDAIMAAFYNAANPTACCEPLDWTETLTPTAWNFGGAETRYDW